MKKNKENNSMCERSDISGYKLIIREKKTEISENVSSIKFYAQQRNGRRFNGYKCQ